MEAPITQLISVAVASLDMDQLLAMAGESVGATEGEADLPAS
jgi:hypothetical protein